MSSKSPASLVNPLTEYRNLISKQGVRELSAEADRLLESQTTGSLMQWLSPNVESDFFVAINKLLTDSVELTLSGELKYSGIQYDSGNGERHWSEYFAVAARNYQKILEIAQNHLPMIQQYQLTFMASAELHNANQQASAAVLARKARDLLERTSSQERIDDVINRGIHEVILAFLEGRFASIQEIVAPYLVQAKRVLEELEIPREQVYDISCALYLHESLQAFSKFMVFGDSSNLDSKKCPCRDADWIW